MDTVQQLLIMLVLTSFMANEADKYKPKPYIFYNGDTLMVREKGYGFCPRYCEADHFHIGHKEHFNCKEDSCMHIVYEDRLN